MDGADQVENDVRRTRDGVLVLLHDATLTRTTDVERVYPRRAPWRVGQFTYRELQRLDAGSWFAPRFAGARIPTLRQWARAVDGDAGMLVEVKDPARYPGIERDLERVVRGTPELRTALRQRRLVVQSFDVGWLRAFDRAAPRVPKAVLYGTRPSGRQVKDAARWAEWLNPSLHVLHHSDVVAAHAAGLRVGVYTVNARADMRRLARWRVDAIITDRPRRLSGVLDRR